MKMNKAAVGYCALIAALSASQFLFADTRTQNFDTDPGWSLLGSGVNGNNFGYQPSSNAGGIPGEAGGTFTRTAGERYYADTNIGIIDLNQPFSASGTLAYTAQENPDWGRPLIVGYFSTSGISTVNVADMVGIAIDNGGFSTQIYWTGVVILADGTDLGVLPKTLLPSPNVVHNWSFSWNPNVSTAGEFEFQLDGTLETVDLTTAQRLTGLSTDAFGWGGGPAPSNQQSDWFANLYADNLAYTVPEPSSITLLVISSLFVCICYRLS
jgi:hypothetical protein